MKPAECISFSPHHRCVVAEFAFIIIPDSPLQEYIKDVPPSPPSPPPSPPSPPQDAKAASKSASPARGHSALVKVETKKPFVFISTFKWEMRKGWDKLVHAYLQVGLGFPFLP